MSVFSEPFTYSDGDLIVVGAANGWVHNEYGAGEPSPVIVSNKYRSIALQDIGAAVEHSNLPANWGLPWSLTSKFKILNADGEDFIIQWRPGMSSSEAGSVDVSVVINGIFTDDLISEIQIHNSNGTGYQKTNLAFDHTAEHKIRIDHDGNNLRVYLDNTIVTFATPFAQSIIPVDFAGVEDQTLSLHSEAQQSPTNALWENDDLKVTGAPISAFATAADGLTMTATLAESGYTPTSGTTADFTLHGSVNGRTISSWSISGTTLTLTFSGAVSSSDTLTVDFDPTASTLSDSAGFMLPGFLAQAVTNNTTVDNVVPTLSNWRVNSSDTTQILATISESGCTPTSGTDGFTLTGTARTVTGWSISGTTLTIQASGALSAGSGIQIAGTGPTFPATVLVKGAHPYYRLGEASGTTATDASASPINGTYAGSGVTYGVAGKVAADSDKAITFDGTDGVLTVSTSVPAALNKTAFTVTGWYNPSGTWLLFKTFASAGVENSKGWVIKGLVGDASYGVAIYNGDGESIKFATENYFTQNVWTFLAVTVTGMTAKLYINGVEITSSGGSWSSGINDYSGTSFFVGARPDGGHKWEGGIDEFAYYPNTVLSGAEILALYNLSNNATPSIFTDGATPANALADFGATDVTALPSAPSSFTATAVSSTQIDLAWTDNSDNESYFSIERSLTGVGSWVEIEQTNPNVQAHIDDTVSPGTTYYYRLTAINGAGNSASVTANATTPEALVVSTSASEVTYGGIDGPAFTLAADISGGVEPYIIAWTCTSKPIGANVVFSEEDTENASATVDLDGSYTFRCTVQDDGSSTEYDEVVVVVDSPGVGGGGASPSMIGAFGFGFGF